jgi:6-phosphogluconolactonase
LNNTVTALNRDVESGKLDTLASVGTLPKGFSGPNYTADIHLAPNGRWLYASNRGHNSIAAFVVGPDDGLLTPIGIFPCRGEIPRGFAIAPEGNLLIVGNQNSDNLAGFRIGKQGELSFLWEKSTPTPVCVRFIQ